MSFNLTYRVRPGQRFVHKTSVQNSQNYAMGCPRIVHSSGSSLNCFQSFRVAALEVGEKRMIEFNCKAPMEMGLFDSVWELKDGGMTLSKLSFHVRVSDDVPLPTFPGLPPREKVTTRSNCVELSADPNTRFQCRWLVSVPPEVRNVAIEHISGPSLGTFKKCRHAGTKTGDGSLKVELWCCAPNEVGAFESCWELKDVDGTWTSHLLLLKLNVLRRGDRGVLFPAFNAAHPCTPVFPGFKSRIDGRAEAVKEIDKHDETEYRSNIWETFTTPGKSTTSSASYSPEVERHARAAPQKSCEPLRLLLHVAEP